MPSQYDIHKEKWINLYNSGVGSRRIAILFNCSHKTVLRCLIEWSVKTDNSIQSRLMRGVNKTPNSCWEWKKYRNLNNYGVVVYRERLCLAHRISYTIFIKDPRDLCVLHRCDNPPCINPEHLFLGTRLDNSRDMVSKGRQSSKLEIEDVIEIRQMHTEGLSYVELGRLFNISDVQARNVVKKTHWSHV